MVLQADSTTPDPINIPTACQPQNYGHTLKESAHKKLVKLLELDSVSYASKDLKGLLDKENPLYPVNRAHAILKMFLNSHSGFDRENLQGYLDLFALVTNPPDEMLSKVEFVVNRAFENPKMLKNRQFYGIDTEV